MVCGDGRVDPLGRSVLADFGSLLQMPNVTGNVQDLRRNATEIADRFADRGATMEVIEIEGASPVVIGELRTQKPTATVGVYVHVPFCERLCPYCDFAVVASRELSRDREDAYVEALRAGQTEHPFTNELEKKFGDVNEQTAPRIRTRGRTDGGDSWRSTRQSSARATGLRSSTRWAPRTKPSWNRFSGGTPNSPDEDRSPVGPFRTAGAGPRHPCAAAASGGTQHPRMPVVRVR